MTPHEYQEQQKARVRAMYNIPEEPAKEVDQTTIELPAILSEETQQTVAPATQENEGE